MYTPSLPLPSMAVLLNYNNGDALPCKGSLLAESYSRPENLLGCSHVGRSSWDPEERGSGWDRLIMELLLPHYLLYIIPHLSKNCCWWFLDWLFCLKLKWIPFSFNLRQIFLLQIIFIFLRLAELSSNIMIILNVRTAFIEDFVDL